MYTLRCTKRALDRFRLIPDDGTLVESDTTLGDWYANLLNVAPKPWVFCLSERCLLAVALPARRGDFATGLALAGTNALAQLGADQDARERELEAMSERIIGRTGSRSVLGVMKDLAFSAEIGLRDGMSPAELSLWL